MTCERFRFGDGSVAILNMGGPNLRITAGGQVFRFEFHEYLGPSMIGKRGDIIQNFPGKYSPFWDALHFWLKQGKRVDADGNCVFEHETKLVPLLLKIGRNRYKVLA